MWSNCISISKAQTAMKSLSNPTRPVLSFKRLPLSVKEKCKRCAIQLENIMKIFIIPVQCNAELFWFHQPICHRAFFIELGKHVYMTRRWTLLILEVRGQGHNRNNLVNMIKVKLLCVFILIKLSTGVAHEKMNLIDFQVQRTVS